MRSEQPIYQLKGVTKSYGDRTVLQIPELTIERGQTRALVGPNGSGKTTLLRILALIDKPTSGQIVFDSVPAWNGAARSMALMRRVTMVSHPPYLFNRSVAYNIAYGIRLRGAPRSSVRRKTEAVLTAVGLEGFEKREARKLSSGEQQRVALARALALEPDVLLLDEPTASIDKRHAEGIEDLIHRLASQDNITVIFSTHNYHQAASLAEGIISLYDGRIEQFTHENLFHGNIFEQNGASVIRMNGALIELATELRGPASVSIHPREIRISREPSASPGLNCCAGQVTAMAAQNSHVRVVVDVGVKLAIELPQDSFNRLQLRLGENVYCIFNRDAVKIA